MHSQVLHKLLMFDLLPAFMVSLDLTFHFFDTVALISVFCKFLASEVGAVEELLAEETHRFIIVFKTLYYFAQNFLVNWSHL